MTRKNVLYGSPLETKIGFSRAVRVGNFITVTATAPIAESGDVAFAGDLYKQTHRCLEIVQKSIEDAGGSLKDVVKTRFYLKDISLWEQAAKAHGEVFSEIKPAAGFIGVKEFIDKDWLVEVEAEAIVED